MSSGFVLSPEPQSKKLLAVRIILATLLLALGLWSGIRLVRILSTDPSTQWGDYLILIFPVTFMALGGGLFHLGATRKVYARKWSNTADILGWGASFTVMAVLTQTDLFHVVAALIGGAIATGGWAIISHAREADRREPEG